MAATPAQTAQRLAPALPQNKFGLLRPFGVDGARDLARGTGDALLKSLAGQVAGTSGEFPWRPEFTSNLDRVRNIKNTEALGEFARTYISQAYATYLPQVLAVRVVADRTARNLELTTTCMRASDVNKQPPKTFTTTAVLPR